LVRRLLPPTEAAQQLKGWMRHRYELVRECTRRKNKLTAICDELFPEFAVIFTDPNGPTALALREQFPTPQTVATAPLAGLIAVRHGRLLRVGMCTKRAESDETDRSGSIPA
jgi:hypothetical protein